MFGLTILGNNSALPAFDRHPTAQALVVNDQVYLIDCGEGTQMQLARYKVRRSRINHILISHLHGDHYFGLVGLLTSMNLLGREMPLHIHAPEPLEAIIRLQLDAANLQPRYALHFHALGDDGLIWEDDKMEISCFAVQHRIPCWGFLFREKKLPRRLLREAAIAQGIPAVFFGRLERGEDYTARDGRVVPNSEVTLPATPGRSYAYCADTRFAPEIADKVREVDLLYHESTYLSDLNERASERFHSTAEQAAKLASLAQARKLLIGHFSSKYEDLTPFLREARRIFPQTELAEEGITFTIPRR